MKSLKFYLVALVLSMPALAVYSQIQIDKPIQLTGAGTDAKITGIKSVTAAQDAASVEAIQKSGFIYGVATGSSNSFNLSLSPVITGSYQPGMVFNFISNQTITGSATLNVDGIGAALITKNFNDTLEVCDIQNGQVVTVVYDGTNFQITSAVYRSAAISTPVATAYSGTTLTQFTANWTSSLGAVGYYLDVSTSATFATYVSGYQNLNVGNVLSYNVTGINCGATYYYRIRAYTNCVTTANSNVINYLACAITQTECGATLTYFPVVNPTTGKVWLDRNLGATRVAVSGTDYQAYGSLFEWGRLADGHECLNWSSATTGTRVTGATSVLSASNVPPSSSFITAGSSPFDWRSGQNNSLWQGVNGINNPCPAGYRIPTQAEWLAEAATWPTDGFSSLLKLTYAGDVNYNTAAQEGSGGNGGYYWASTVTGIYAYNYSIKVGGVSAGDNRAYGESVRCIMN